MYLPGIVQAQNGEKIHVKYETGEQEWTTISMVRVKRRLADVGGPSAQVHQGPGISSGTGISGPMAGGMGGPTRTLFVSAIVSLTSASRSACQLVMFILPNTQGIGLGPAPPW